MYENLTSHGAWSPPYSCRRCLQGREHLFQRMQQPLVSIVLPTHNGARFLQRSIVSCLDQTHRRLELIVVDDASTDETAEIARSYAAIDERVRWVSSTTPLRLPGALNRGFELASGDFLTWTSDDNYYMPHAIERLLQIFAQRPSLDVVYSDEIRVDENDRPLGLCRFRRPEYLVDFSCIGGCFLYRRRLRDIVGDYDVNCFLAEDYDFWLRAYVRGLRMLHLEEALYYYRLHGASLSTMHGKSGIDRVVTEVRARHLRWYHIVGAALRRYISWILSPARMRSDRAPRFVPVRESGA